MNPRDNPYLSPDYISRLKMLSANKRLRFLEGKYQDDLGSLFKRGWFKYEKKLPDFIRIVIGVDPSGSATGDEVGIIVAAIDKDRFLWILDDYSLQGSPKEWSDAVASAYDKWGADLVVAEKNFGGDMVESTIKNGHPHLNVKLIWSARGKIVRAEPISALYEQGKVYHRRPFFLLEDEYCSYIPGAPVSPNRMDAAVFALTELSGNNISILDAF
jgi:phage terminase large subunit-like protein